MSVLAEFFKGSETQMGIFAPRGYVVALFPDLSATAKAERNLLDAGFPPDEVIAVPGDDVVQLVKEHASHSSVGTFVMQGLPGCSRPKRSTRTTISNWRPKEPDSWPCMPPAAPKNIEPGPSLSPPIPLSRGIIRFPASSISRAKLKARTLLDARLLWTTCRLRGQVNTSPDCRKRSARCENGEENRALPRLKFAHATTQRRSS